MKSVIRLGAAGGWRCLGTRTNNICSFENKGSSYLRLLGGAGSAITRQQHTKLEATCSRGDSVAPGSV